MFWPLNNAKRSVTLLEYADTCDLLKCVKVINIYFYHECRKWVWIVLSLNIRQLMSCICQGDDYISQTVTTTWQHVWPWSIYFVYYLFCHSSLGGRLSNYWTVRKGQRHCLRLVIYYCICGDLKYVMVMTIFTLTDES